MHWLWVVSGAIVLLFPLGFDGHEWWKANARYKSAIAAWKAGTFGELVAMDEASPGGTPSRRDSGGTPPLPSGYKLDSGKTPIDFSDLGGKRVQAGQWTNWGEEMYKFSRMSREEVVAHYTPKPFRPFQTLAENWWFEVSGILTVGLGLGLILGVRPQPK